MKTATKVWLILAAILVLAGCVLFAATLSSLDWGFMKLSTDKYETNTHKISESFENISVDTVTAQIVFAPSNDGFCTVVCHEDEKAKHTVSVKDGTLTIEIQDDRSVFDFVGHIGINFDTPKITVYLPKTECGSLYIREDTGDVEIPKEFTFRDVDISVTTGAVGYYASASGAVKIRATTGSIQVESISAPSLDLTVTTGKVTLSDAQCTGDVKIFVTTGKAVLSDLACYNVISAGSTGGLTLENVIATQKLSLERSTGDIKLESCDAAEIYIKTDTGDITGSLLSEKMFYAHTDTGHADVPKSTSGGKCEITTDTGDIRITVKSN